MLGNLARYGTALSVPLVGALTYWFARRQNAAEKMGGALAPPKAIWLAMAVLFWFCWAPLFAFDAGVAPGMRLTLQVFFGSMVVRGVVELFILYRRRTWRPRYGVIATSGSLLLLLAAAALTFDEAWFTSGPSWAAAGFILLLALSLIVEIGYAAAFGQVIQDRSTGRAGVWFASDAPEFRAILALTRRLNAVFLGLMLGVVWLLWRGGLS